MSDYCSNKPAHNGIVVETTGHGIVCLQCLRQKIADAKNKVKGE